MPEKKKLSKTREMLVNEYIKSLEQDQLPWIKDWGSKPPHNAITRTPYRLLTKFYFGISKNKINMRIVVGVRYDRQNQENGLLKRERNPFH